MKITPITFNEDVKNLLEQHDLPTEDLPEDHIQFYKIVKDNLRIGYGAFEDTGDNSLLRSVVIKPQFQSKGYGRKFVRFLIDETKKRGFKGLYLLTKTAESFFQILGFKKLKEYPLPEIFVIRKNISLSVRIQLYL